MHDMLPTLWRLAQGTYCTMCTPSIIIRLSDLKAMLNLVVLDYRNLYYIYTTFELPARNCDHKYY